MAVVGEGREARVRETRRTSGKWNGIEFTEERTRSTVMDVRTGVTATMSTLSLRLDKRSERSSGEGNTIEVPRRTKSRGASLARIRRSISKAKVNGAGEGRFCLHIQLVRDFLPCFFFFIKEEGGGTQIIVENVTVRNMCILVVRTKHAIKTQ